MSPVETGRGSDTIESARLEGAKASILSVEAFHLLKPEFGIILFEPNVVLVLSGMKPLTTTSVYDVSPDDLPQQVKILDRDIFRGETIGRDTIGICDIESFHSKDLTHTKDVISVKNLAALADVTKETKISDVPVYVNDKTVETIQTWDRDMYDRFIIPKENGELDLKVIFWNGIHLGYPDVAILDYYDWCLHDSEKPIVLAHIPGTKKTYYCETPNFYIYEEHRQEPSIRRYLQKAGDVLDAFYKNPSVISVMKSAVYTDARIHRQHVAE